MLLDHGYSFPETVTGSADLDSARTLPIPHPRKCMNSRSNVHARLNLPITTHVAESSEEYAMFAESSGELYDFLKQLGRPMTDCGSTSPLRHLIENGLINPDCIVAHLNELDDRDLELLSQPEWRNLQIVHCPKSHRFLHHKRFPLEALRERGLNILSRHGQLGEQ